ncbi:hypothetical protein ACFVFD_00670 [Streptomyces fimicarius]|uniref:hypothetical protein n=1 Tax=Streptomyces griseus TaxID=1911 RepID=UPI0036C3C32A
MDFTDQLGRLARAHELGADLSANVQAWGDSGSCSAQAVIASDRLSWELRLRVAQPPPLAEWGFRFGEAINHLRSTLDNLVVAVARQSGTEDPARLRALMFPICDVPKDWRNRQKALSCLPEWCRDALEQLQPLQRPAQGGSLEEDLLRILRDLDNTTKHHLQVKPELAPQSIHHAPAVEFETEEGAAASVPPDTQIVVAPFEDGAVLLRHRTKGRIESVKGNYSFTAQVQVVLADGRTFGVTELLAALWEYTNMVLSFVIRRATQEAV